MEASTLGGQGATVTLKTKFKGHINRMNTNYIKRLQIRVLLRIVKACTTSVCDKRRAFFY